ncbi:MAG: protein kinase domain-containing protein, partial [Candidatus Polarisedimenticolia bacterium]
MAVGIAGGLVNGRYRLVRSLGEGGMGTVYLAADLAEEQRPVALKKVHSALLTPEAIEALRAEFSLMTRLRHPHVVEVYDLGLDASTGDPFLTLEYIEGDDFRMACEGRPLAEQVELMAQVCRGLNYIHSRGLTHNDLKPQNILVTASSPRICKLTDFGLASIDTREAATSRQGLRGTLQYLAPELIHGEKPDRRSDLYALGVLFYLVLAGRLPFDGTVPEILTATTSSDPTPLRAVRPDLPPALEALVLRLLSRNPAARPESAAAVLARLNEAAGTSHPVETAGTIALSARSTRFVGRGKEMERLIRQLEACAGADDSRPTCRLMMVSGESGIGKSRLIRQLRYEAQMRGIQVLAGVCYEGTASAFHPFVQILRQLRPAEADGAGRDFQALVGADNPVPGADPERERRRLSDAGVQALLDAAQDRPVMICVEDLQWADTATLNLLEHLARNVAHAPRLLLLISYRSEEAEAPPLISALPRLVRAGTWERLELARLREEHVAEMMRGIFGMEEAPAPLVSLVARETEGNPFFVQMALEGLLEDSPMLEGLEDLEQIRFPRSMTEAITRRLADLDPLDRRVMESLAVIECPVGPGMLAAIVMPEVSGGSQALLGGAVDRLRRRRLVRQELDDTGCVRLRLDHVKLRDHVYEAMDWQERRDLHGVIGLALEAGGNAALEELAHHFTHSPDDARALEYAERGGLHALSLMATERAISYLERALELVPQKEPERRLQLQLNLGDAYRQARDHARAMETYEKVVRGARTAGIKDMAWTATLHLLDLQQRSGLYEEAQRGAEKITPALEAEGRKALLARCLTTLAVIAAIQGRLDEARDLNMRALALRREVEDIRGQALNLNNLGSIDSLAGDTATALPLLEEALALHRQAGDIQRSIETLMNIAHWHRFAGDMALSVSRFEEAADMARRAHDRWLLSLAETALAGLYHLQGRLDAALSIARRAVSDAQSVGNEERECEALDVLGIVQRDLGDPGGALSSHERAVTLARRAGHLSQEIYAIVSASLDKLAGSPHEGDLRSVRDALRKAARAGAEIPSDKLKARLHEAMGRCHLASGEPAAALDSARQSVDAARASRVPAAIASAELLLAECLLAPGLPERDPAEAAEAARRVARLGAEAGLPEPRWR